MIDNPGREIAQDDDTEIRIADYPLLKLVCWNRAAEGRVSRAEALALYERNWRHINDQSMTAAEQKFFDDIVANEGAGVFMG